jgi:hypothetical protein
MADTNKVLNSTANGAAAGASFGPWGAVIGGAAGLVGGILSGNAEDEAIKKQQKNTAALMEQARQDRLNAYTQGAGQARDIYNSGLSQLDKLYNTTNGVFAGQIATAKNQADLSAARSGLTGGSQAQNLLNPSITAATVQAHQEQQQAQLQLLEQFGQNMQSLSGQQMGIAGNLESGAQAGVIQAGTSYANPLAQGLSGMLAGAGSGLQADYLLNRQSQQQQVPQAKAGIGGQ